MKINFDTKLVHIDGETLKLGAVDMTLKAGAIEALFTITESDQRATGEEKFKRYELGQKINGGGEVEITPEEATLLKKRIGEVYGVAVVGPAYKLLNGYTSIELAIISLVLAVSAFGMYGAVHVLTKLW